MNPLFLPFPDGRDLAERLAERFGGEVCPATLSRFPDGETYVRIDGPVFLKDVLVVARLDRPDEKFLPLSYLAATARDLGANRVGLIAPYLPYLRQDRRFQPGESVTSHHFARLVSSTFDWLATVDPHLHRIPSLGNVYTIPVRVASSAPAIARWIAANVERPFVLGPDAESAAWTARVAEAAGVPHAAFEKTRRGPDDVAIRIPDLSAHRDRTPVLVDDIIATGRTMVESVRGLLDLGFPRPVCIGVPAIFAGDAWQVLRAAGPAAIVTTNTIPHPTNAIDVTEFMEKTLSPVTRSMPRPTATTPS